MKIFILRDDEHSDRVKRGLYNELKSLDLTKPKQVAITEYKEDKTNSQRSTFHFLCGLLAQETGNTPADVKEAIKQDMLGLKTISLGGVDREITRSSEEAKRDEYSLLIEGVYIEATSNGVILPILEIKQ